MKPEKWNSRLGVILAVAGSAVGLGNFLKFPGQVAMYGGAAFMIAYVASFFVIGVPISIVEWTMGRHGGANGYNSPPGILGFFCRSKKMAYVGLLGVLLTLMVYCYYIYIEAWCLGYAFNFAAGSLSFNSLEESAGFFGNFIGAGENGSAIRLGTDGVMVFFAVSFALNFWLIHRGVSRGIELFCKYAMPTLVVLAIILVVRLLTMGSVSPDHPERSINQGLGFMWNPVKVVLEQRESSASPWVEVRQLVGDAEIEAVSADIKKSSGGAPALDMRIRRISVFEQLMNPSIWIAAAGQVFFSLTVGFGAIMTYASYLKRRDDIVLSSLTSCSANEFCEVCLGGLITVPAAVAFFGVSGAIGAGLSLFDLGFKVLPLFFVSMPLGQLFGFLFFFLLFLAAVTSSLSMLQPGLAFIEESMKLRRNFSTLLLGVIAVFVSGFIVYFSAGLKAMDTMDFWMGQVAIYFFAMIQVMAFAWHFGAARGMRLANEGSDIKLPAFFGALVKYITPTILLAVFLFWLAKDVFGVVGGGKLSPYIADLVGSETSGANPVAWMTVFIIAAVYVFFALVLFSSRRYDRLLYGKRSFRDAFLNRSETPSESESAVPAGGFWKFFNLRKGSAFLSVGRIASSLAKRRADKRKKEEK